MTDQQHEERRAWWAIQSEKRALAKRIEEGSISFAHRVEVEEQIRFAEESYRDGLRGLLADAQRTMQTWSGAMDAHTREVLVAHIAELEARLSEVSR